ncbi:SDR family NAD(P)-dependent oxidoreductase [Thalassotalea eurytherma]|uniref:Short-chain dehydrogenase n=1 Tax=Thalassotalea eurytherma TaxID=1144278 RepID=A0ABQ6H623_9GAMM|nr:SDR family oxidoreductase [Thalassotalea eurytherma]GLX83592.1 short-chain dehydrogenase [Thalassotalea eurytherma]
MTEKVCIVTGGSSGIGLAIVQRFLEANYLVYNLDMSPSSVGEFKACDISNVDQVNDIIKAIAQEHTIDALVSNAGIHFSATIEDTTEQDLEKVFNINVKGAYGAIKAVLPNMKASKQGSIVLMASDQALVGKRNSFAYNLSKSALASMAKTTALDYAAYNIRANAVCPGTIETPLYHKAIDNYCLTSGAEKAQVHLEEEAQQPIGRLGQPEEVAELVFFLCTYKASFITGSLQVIDGGYTAQ